MHLCNHTRHVYVPVHAQAHVHAYAHTHMHTHTHTPPYWLWHSISWYSVLRPTHSRSVTMQRFFSRRSACPVRLTVSSNRRVAQTCQASCWPVCICGRDIGRGARRALSKRTQYIRGPLHGAWGGLNFCISVQMVDCGNRSMPGKTVGAMLGRMPALWFVTLPLSRNRPPCLEQPQRWRLMTPRMLLLMPPPRQRRLQVPGCNRCKAGVAATRPGWYGECTCAMGAGRGALGGERAAGGWDEMTPSANAAATSRQHPLSPHWRPRAYLPMHAQMPSMPSVKPNKRALKFCESWRKEG